MSAAPDGRDVGSGRFSLASAAFPLVALVALVETTRAVLKKPS